MPIELRHRTYFAYLDVPKDVRRILEHFQVEAMRTAVTN